MFEKFCYVFLENLQVCSPELLEWDHVAGGTCALALVTLYKWGFSCN